jgi:hypothetical protein
MAGTPDSSTNSLLSAILNGSNPYASIIGGLGSAIASPLATGAANAGEANMEGQQSGVYNQLLNLWNPQYITGVGANANLQSVLGLNGAAPNYSAFENSPGYQFALQQTNNNVDRQAAASGNLYSTNTLGSIANYDSGLASTNYQNYVSQLMNAAGLGQGANQGLQGGRLTTGNNIGAGLVNQGANTGAGIAGGIAGGAQALGGLFNLLGGGGSTNGSNNGSNNSLLSSIFGGGNNNALQYNSDGSLAGTGPLQLPQVSPLQLDNEGNQIIGSDQNPQ